MNIFIGIHFPPFHFFPFRYDDTSNGRLAAMIVGSGVELEKLFQTILESGFLGECNMQYLNWFKEGQT